MALLVVGMQYARGGHMLEEARYDTRNACNQMDNDDEGDRHPLLNSTQAGMKSDPKVSSRSYNLDVCMGTR